MLLIFLQKKYIEKKITIIERLFKIHEKFLQRSPVTIYTIYCLFKFDRENERKSRTIAMIFILQNTDTSVIHSMSVTLSVTQS